MLTLIAARSRNDAIGKGNTIPWDAPEDMAFFARETAGGAVIMGRNTWDSLPKKPLPRRMNIVVTTRPFDGDAVASTLDQSLRVAQEAGHARIYGIGGQRIYEGLLPHADRLLVTEVDLEIEDADAFFPAFDPADWRLAGKQTLRADGPTCILHEYLRR